MIPSVRRAAAALAAVLSLAGCDSDRAPAAGAAPPAASPRPSAAPQGSGARAREPGSVAGPPSADAAPSEPATRVAAKGRLVAIGDLHGDLAATRAALRLAGAIDERDHWSGGDLTVVQTGDQIDRGDEDREVLDLFDRLAGEAEKAGGALHALNGNHEVMNVDLDFRYVTEGSFRGFAGVPGARTDDARLAPLPPEARTRAAAFLPGAPYARLLAKRHTLLVVGDTAFAHGGILPAHVRYGLGRIDREVREWMDGKAPSAPSWAKREDGPVWSRRYSAAPDAKDCEVLGEALAAIPAKRMVVGHTVQRGGISPACGDRVWRIDVGLSKYYGGRIEVLEIRGDEVKPLREKR